MSKGVGFLVWLVNVILGLQTDEFKSPLSYKKDGNMWKMSPLYVEKQSKYDGLTVKWLTFILHYAILSPVQKKQQTLLISLLPACLNDAAR